MSARIVNRLPQFIDATERRAARGMVQALGLGASEASVLTPIDSSDLLNSQYRDVQKQGTKVVGTVGYTANYALPVHDPKHPQKFRRATAVKEFLVKGFERKRTDITAALKGALKP